MASRDQVYLKFGLTSEAAQLFETALGTIVLAGTGHNESWFEIQNPQAASEALTKIESSTLGRVLAMLNEQVSFEDEVVVNHFRCGLKARNELCHGFFERHNFKIDTEEGREEMIEDLEKLHEVLLKSWQLASGIANALVPTDTS